MILFGVDTISNDMLTELNLEEPTAQYFPFLQGDSHKPGGKVRGYSVGPRLHKMDFDFGNPHVDAKNFQLDHMFSQYRASKMRARNEDISKYVGESDLRPKTAEAVFSYMLQTLQDEYPEKVVVIPTSGGYLLDAHHTGDVIHFARDFSHFKLHHARDKGVSYSSPLDALAMQIQEDMTILQLNSDGSNYMTAMHFCSPSRLDPRRSIGKDFDFVHTPVPKFSEHTRKPNHIVHSMVHGVPRVRFAWGIRHDARLNHHGEAPKGIDHGQWWKKFNPKDPQLYVMTERQSFRGFPEAGASLFLVRKYFYDMGEIKHTQPHVADALIRTIEEMDPQHHQYKGITDTKEGIIEFLRDR